jgi:hypothetical protein
MFEQIGVIFVQICAGRETIAQLPSNQRNFVLWVFDEHLPSEVQACWGTNGYRQESPSGESKLYFFKKSGFSPHTVSWYQFASAKYIKRDICTSGVLISSLGNSFSISLFFFKSAINTVLPRAACGQVNLCLRINLSPFAANTSSSKFGKHLPAFF